MALELARLKSQVSLHEIAEDISDDSQASELSAQVDALRKELQRAHAQRHRIIQHSDLKQPIAKQKHDTAQAKTMSRASGFNNSRRYQSPQAPAANGAPLSYTRQASSPPSRLGLEGHRTATPNGASSSFGDASTTSAAETQSIFPAAVQTPSFPALSEQNIERLQTQACDMAAEVAGAVCGVYRLAQLQKAVNGLAMIHKCAA